MKGKEKEFKIMPYSLSHLPYISTFHSPSSPVPLSHVTAPLPRHSTRFLQLSSPEGKEEFEKIVHYMRFALAIYGWPMFVVTSSTVEVCKLCPMLRCVCGDGVIKCADEAPEHTLNTPSPQTHPKLSRTHMLTQNIL